MSITQNINYHTVKFQYLFLSPQYGIIFNTSIDVFFNIYNHFYASLKITIHLIFRSLTPMISIHHHMLMIYFLLEILDIIINRSIVVICWKKPH